MSGTVELVADLKMSLGEGPSWDSVRRAVYWVDINRHRVYTYNPANGDIAYKDVGQYVGAVVPRRGGGWALAMYNGFYVYDPSADELKALSEPEADLPDNRFNDGKCDPAGRFWAGSMSLNGAKHTGTLYRLDPDGKVTPQVRGVTVSNGLAWSTDHRTMYYIDTPTMEVVAYDYDLATGGIGNPRPVVRFGAGIGVPDGMTIDAEGMLWIAHWGGWKVSRWDPASGKQLEEIAVPAAQVTSCVFGGENLDELYITTARTGISEADLERQPQAGGVFKVKPGVKGTPTYAFAG